MHTLTDAAYCVSRFIRVNDSSVSQASRLLSFVAKNMAQDSEKTAAKKHGIEVRMAKKWRKPVELRTAGWLPAPPKSVRD